jgi:diguanylate cyclase (GGDEF)-like protein/PAS domain S-box-containing protein
LAPAAPWLLDIVEGTPVPTFVIDSQHRVTHWNRACEAVMGVPASAMIGTTDQWKAFYPHPRPVMADIILSGAMEETVASHYPGKYHPSPFIEGAWEAEDFFPNFPGGGRWLAFTAALLHDAEGRVVGAVETLQDITLRRRAEAGRQESECRLMDIVQGSPVPTFVIDAQHRVTHWNRACEAVMGVPASAIIGTTDQWKAFYPHPRPVLADIVLDGGTEAAIRHHYLGKYRKSPLIEGAWEVEDYFTHFPAGDRWLIFTAAPLHDADGHVVGTIETLQDVTDRRRAEAALRLRERAVESTGNAVFITDFGAHDTPVVYCNPAFERMTGYGRAEVLGRSPRFLLGDDLTQVALEDLEAALRRHQSGSAVLRNYRKDGTLFWAEVYIAPVRDDQDRVTHFVNVMADISERVDYEQQLEHLANHDALTTLANRNLLMNRLEHALACAQRFDDRVAVLFADLDNFKSINDAMGHGVGDALVQEAARRLVDCLRDVDTVARLGGDEFVILLHGSAGELEITHVMRRIGAAFSQPFDIAGTELFVSCSVGAALYPRDGHDAVTLLKNADAAMYRAKELGRGGFQFFTQAINEQITERLAIEGELHGAIERGEMAVHYQPQLDVETGAIVGAEALLRWTNRKLGPVSPARFIPIAEESGLIVAIGRWVLETACADARVWKAEFPGNLRPDNLRMSVNLSARQFRHAELFQDIAGLLNGPGLDTLILELEITESMVMQNPASAIETMRLLKDIGLRLAIDDFGTGYSSLSQLRHFPIDILKVDQAFVRDVSRHADGEAITAAVISLGHALGKKVVAEGVETLEQLDFLRRHGCDEYQGFLFSPAVPASRFAELLRAGQPASPPVP